ncbi:hypothetical protein Asppvi_009896 [Aspergillus pseudoviridinutans]|uniref:Uncharacterized protein n=1 Tax=Aspergillus pseudoviridinutans TaxID=1517512 RepID=A0A9P3BGM7_9EURO|nr:uncharacterized protein Asppvi_009896 [Aspergillus pseudoviridinutans]GIJ90931.1 hypothetical protein Asppvi_009896 [Aspergillus pseudoviridinutans]
MTFNITLERSQRSPSDEEDSSGVVVSPPSAPPSEAHPEGQQEWHDPYDEGEKLEYPDELRLSTSARRRRSYERERLERFRRRSRARSRPRWHSESVSRSSPNCLINSGENERDITLHLDLDAALDISKDLERLAQLNRRGHFSQAIALFHERLASHVDFFPVVAEYADLLLEQGSFGQLRRFISSRLLDPLVRFADEEVLLLKLLKSVAEIYTNGALIPALEMTLEALKHLERRCRELRMWFRPPTGVQIQLIETCLRVITYAAAHSSFLGNDTFRVLLRWTFSNDRLTLKPNGFTPFYPQSADDMAQEAVHSDNSESDRKTSHRLRLSGQHEKAAADNKSPPEGNVSQSNYPRIGDWYRLLVQEGFWWESHRVLRFMLPLLGDAHGKYTANGNFEDFAQIDDLLQATAVFLRRETESTDDEQLLLTDFANAYLLSVFFTTDSHVETVRTVRAQSLDSARSLASTILSTHRHLVNSVPYLRWLLRQTPGAETGYQVQSPDLQQGRIPEKWFQGSVSQIRSPEQRNHNIHPPLARGKLAKADSGGLSQRSLEIALETVTEIGGYRLRQYVLERMYTACQNFDQALRLLHDLAQLCKDTMQDITRYGESLVDEHLLLESANPSNIDELRIDLHHRFSDLNGSFPSHINYNSSTRKRLGLVFFDIPALEWNRRRAWSELLSSMGRGIEAELVNARLSYIYSHLPSDSPSLTDNSRFCFGCPYCGNKAKQELPPPADVEALGSLSHLGPRPNPSRLAIARERHRTVGAENDVADHVEDRIIRRRAARNANEAGFLAERTNLTKEKEQ